MSYLPANLYNNLDYLHTTTSTTFTQQPRLHSHNNLHTTSFTQQPRQPTQRRRVQDMGYSQPRRRKKKKSLICKSTPMAIGDAGSMEEDRRHNEDHIVKSEGPDSSRNSCTGLISCNCGWVRTSLNIWLSALIVYYYNIYL